MYSGFFVLAGAGIYVTTSELLYSSSSLPNNSIITSSVVPDVSSHQIAFYCCSNSTTSGSTGTFIGLNGYSYSGIINVERYGSSHSYAGCMYLYLPGRYYFQNYSSFNDEGIYTCRMPDSTGRNIDVSIGIYREDYTGKFIELYRSRSSASCVHFIFQLRFNIHSLYYLIIYWMSASQECQVLCID